MIILKIEHFISVCSCPDHQSDFLGSFQSTIKIFAKNTVTYLWQIDNDTPACWRHSDWFVSILENHFFFYRREKGQLLASDCFQIYVNVAQFLISI